jgi:tetrapyrrole methylase family protein / MazG family protein
MRPDLLATIERRHHIHASEGLQLAGPSALAARPIDPTWPLLVLPADEGTGPTALAALAEGEFRPLGLPGRGAHPTAALALLRSLYPADHPALSVAEASDTTVGRLTEADLGAEAWLLPALAPAAAAVSPFALPWLVARLRAPDGCPWDREQTHQSLRKHLLEEAYEVYDALEDGSTAALADELGDLLLQVVLHAQYGAEAGVFDLADVQAAIGAKIVRRHPHVFGETHVESVGDVLRNWETIKAAERAASPPGPAAERDARMPASFAGLSRSLPALAYAQEIQERAASLGYDWRDLEGIIDKVGEEAAELLAAEGPAERAEEFGDLLLVLVNLARRLGVDAEAALRGASAKFAARFAHVERLAEARQVVLRDLSLDELDELWVIAKRAIDDERQHPGQGRSEDPS